MVNVLIVSIIAGASVKGVSKWIFESRAADNAMTLVSLCVFLWPMCQAGLNAWTLLTTFGALTGYIIGAFAVANCQLPMRTS